MKLQLFAFNTGRMYAKDDQPIIWGRLENGAVMFKDIGRGIDGYIDQIPTHIDPREMPRHIMSRYDLGQYASWHRAGEPSWYEIDRQLVEAAAEAARKAPRLRL